MNKIVQIFLKFLKLMRENGRDLKKAKAELAKEGFLPSDIEASLEWYFGETLTSKAGAAADSILREPSFDSFRLFTLAEQRLLSYEARGYITEMLAARAISFEEVESVIETLNLYMVEDATIEDINNIMIGFRAADVSGIENSEDTVEFKVRYIQ